jgi:Tfp pilus assembly protein PilF
MRYKLLFVVILILCACKEPRSIIDNDNSQKSKAFITAFHEGLRLKLQGNYNKAIERFEFCLQEEPRDDASHFAMAQTFLLLGDLAQGRNLYDFRS